MNYPSETRVHSVPVNICLTYSKPTKKTIGKSVKYVQFNNKETRTTLTNILCILCRKNLIRPKPQLCTCKC